MRIRKQLIQLCWFEPLGLRIGEKLKRAASPVGWGLSPHWHTSSLNNSTEISSKVTALLNETRKIKELMETFSTQPSLLPFLLLDCVASAALWPIQRTSKQIKRHFYKRKKRKGNEKGLLCCSASQLSSAGPVWPGVGGCGRSEELCHWKHTSLPRSEWHTVSHTSEKYMLSLICQCIHPQLKGNLQSKCKDFICAEQSNGAEVSISIKFPVKQDFILFLEYDGQIQWRF